MNSSILLVLLIVPTVCFIVAVWLLLCRRWEDGLDDGSGVAVEEDKKTNSLAAHFASMLPYGLKCKVKGYSMAFTLSTVQCTESNGCLLHLSDGEGDFVQAYPPAVKPYLFPLSSMTAEQTEELKALCGCYEALPNGIIYMIGGGSIPLSYHSLPFELFVAVTDWLNANHFDIHGLLDNGIAIDARGLKIY